MINERTTLNGRRSGFNHCLSSLSRGWADIEISRTGYHLWRAAGRPAGRFRDFLFEAEKQFAGDQVARAEQG
jgi:hypothetical protein